MSREYDVMTITTDPNPGGPRLSDGTPHPRRGEQLAAEERMNNAAARRRYAIADAYFEAAAEDPSWTTPSRPQSELADECDVLARRRLRDEREAQFEALQAALNAPPAPPVYRLLSAQTKVEIRYTAMCFRAEGPPEGMIDLRLDARLPRGGRHFFSPGTGRYMGTVDSLSGLPLPPAVTIEDGLAALVAVPDRWTPEEFPNLDAIRFAPAATTGVPYPLLLEEPSEEQVTELVRRWWRPRRQS